MHLQDRDLFLCGQVCYLCCDQGKLPGNDGLHGAERLLMHSLWLVERRVWQSTEMSLVPLYVPADIMMTRWQRLSKASGTVHVFRCVSAR